MDISVFSLLLVLLKRGGKGRRSLRQVRGGCSVFIANRRRGSKPPPTEPPFPIFHIRFFSSKPKGSFGQPRGRSRGE